MPKPLRLSLSLVLVAIAALALGASTASAAPKGNRLRLQRRRHLPARPGQPERGLQPDRQRDHQLRRRPDLVAGRQTARLRRQVHRHQRREHLHDGTRRPGPDLQPRDAGHPLPDGLVPIGEIAWSPDGRRSPSSAAANLGSNALFTWSTPTGPAPPRPKSRPPAAAPRPGPRTAARSPSGTANQIYTVPANNSSPATALPGATCSEPAWSPDGGKIACGREFQNVQIFGPSGGTPLTTITN